MPLRGRPNATDNARDTCTSSHSLKRSTGSAKRVLFWKNVVRQFNFKDEHERELVIGLTHGVNWMRMSALPRRFMQRHRGIFHLIATSEYKRSSMVRRDVPRTFSIFERSQLPRDINAKEHSLFRILNAVAEAENGYCQGMNFVAGMFLVEGLEESDAFALFMYILRRCHVAQIYKRRSPFLDDYFHHFSEMFKRELPELSAHMNAQGFTVPMYGVEWFTTLFSLSTRLDLASALFDLFLVGIRDVFLRVALAILKLLEPKLLCMSFEDFLREFKPLVRQVDPYQAIFMALSIPPNHAFKEGDTIAHLASRMASQWNTKRPKDFKDGQETDTHSLASTVYGCHRTLPPDLIHAIEAGDFQSVRIHWQHFAEMNEVPGCRRMIKRVLADEILHFATWFGQATIALFAIECCGADVSNRDDNSLTPLHFAVLRNQPAMVRVLLSAGASTKIHGGLSRYDCRDRGLTALELAKQWKHHETSAARVVLEHDVCVYCDTRFDLLTFSKEKCHLCGLSFCSQPRSCMVKHSCPMDTRMIGDQTRSWAYGSKQFQCSGTRERRRTWSGWANEVRRSSKGSALMYDGEQDPSDLELDSDVTRSSLDSSASWGMSIQCSQYQDGQSDSSSFVYVPSPSAPQDSNQLSMLTTSTTESSLCDGESDTDDDTEQEIDDERTGSRKETSLVDRVNGFLRLPRDEVLISDSNNDDGAVCSRLGCSTSQSRFASWQLLCELPDRPSWYCNEPTCHAVFSLFLSGNECDRCGGYFCRVHLNDRKGKATLGSEGGVHIMCNKCQRRSKK